MQSRMKSYFFALVSLLLVGQAHAAPISVTFDNFGALPAATFGGSGIPNDAVAITSTSDFVLAMSSHGRYENLLEGNDGAGTYFASPGSNIPPSSTIEGATWNFNFYISLLGGLTFGDNVDFNVYYDFDPAAGNDISTHGVFNIRNSLALFAIDPATQTLAEGSQNLFFNFLSLVTPAQTPPSSPMSFDPNATGEYTFAIVATELSTGAELARTAIRVVVSDVNEPAIASLLLVGLLVAARRTRRR